jgi:uncharacterized membrane protein
MLLLAAVSLAFLAASLLHPLLKGEPNRVLGELLGRTCHRLPRRSLHMPWGISGLCARCTAFWAAAGVTALLMATRLRPPGLAAGLLLISPLAVDGGLQYLGLYESTNLLRVVTGLAAGAGVAFLYSGLARRIAFGRAS